MSDGWVVYGWLTQNDLEKIESGEFAEVYVRSTREQAEREAKEHVWDSDDRGEVYLVEVRAVKLLKLDFVEQELKNPVIKQVKKEEGGRKKEKEGKVSR